MNILYNKTLRSTLAFLFATVLCLPTSDAACYDTDGDGIVDTCDAQMGPIQRIRTRAAARQTARAAANTSYVQSYNSSVRYSTPRYSTRTVTYSSPRYTTYRTSSYGSNGGYAAPSYGSSGNYATSLPYGITLAPGEVLMSVGPATTTASPPAASDAAEAQPAASGSTGCSCPSDVGPRLEKIEKQLQGIEQDLSDLKAGGDKNSLQSLLGPLPLSLNLPQSVQGPKLVLSSGRPASVVGPHLALKPPTSSGTLASL